MDSVCTFSCDKGFGLSNTSLINTTCTNNDLDAIGDWSSEAPTCIGKHFFTILLEY